MTLQRRLAAAKMCCPGAFADSRQNTHFPLSLTIPHQSLRMGVIHGQQIVPAGDLDMLAAIGRQMDVDVLISGGTHRWVRVVCTGCPAQFVARESRSFARYPMSFHRCCWSLDYLTPLTPPSPIDHGVVYISQADVLCRFEAFEAEGRFFINPGSATGAWSGLWNGWVFAAPTLCSLSLG